MNQNPADELLTELREALDVTPSREFAATVRLRVETDRAPAWRAWAMAAAGLGAVTLVVFAVKSEPNPTPVHPEPRVAVGRTAAERPSAAPVTVVPAVPRKALRGRAEKLQGSEVLVPADTMLGLEQLRARLGDGTLDASSLPVLSTDRIGPVLPVPASAFGVETARTKPDVLRAFERLRLFTE